MDDNSNKKSSTYEVVNFSSNNSKKEKRGASKSIIIPFISGVIGASLVIGICFGVPEIKNTLIGTNSPTPTNNNSYTPSETLTKVSLSNYSDVATSVASKVQPSIVGIEVEYSINSIFSSNGSAKASGSGIIISSDGYILTNNHIVNSSSTNSAYYEVAKASSLKVYLYNDETAYDAKIIGTDEQTDLAVIKIEKNDLTAAELGDSDSIKVGEFAMAIGNPLGMQSSVTSGIISAVNRKVTDSDGKTFTLIQTDAAINAGNSGGALVNSDGKVIGINTLKLSGTGIEGMGFAIPINSTINIYEQLIQYNKVKRPYIGISGIDLDEKTAERNKLVVGVYIKSIDDFSSAEKAGLKVGDVIIEADGKKITTMDELNQIKNAHKIGDEMKLKVYRNAKEESVNLTLAEQP